MYFVYFLRSESNPDKTYTGSTENLVKRLGEHNTGMSTHTARFMPWKVEAFILTETREVAEKAEEYFANTSGKEKFLNFAAANPNHPNPIEGFFNAQEVGRLFGRTETGFKISNKILMMTESRRA